MLQESKAKALTLLLVVFVVGGFMGWLAHELSQGSPPPYSTRDGVEPLVTRYKKELHLSAAQADSVRAILTRSRRETRALWQGLRPQFMVIREQAKSEIEAQLTPDQRPRLEAFNAEMERERVRADSTRVQRP
jgi:hypothetical protein